MNLSLSVLFLLFLLYSFLGWIMEVIVTIHDDKKLVNRGFLVGPYCPIYGVGVLLMIFLLNKYLDDPIVLFVMAVLICSILEYFTGYLMEKLFKARWWDYSNKKFNINGRICLENLAAFGLLGLLVMYIVNPYFIKVLSTFNITVLNVLAIILAVIFIIDIGISLKIISGFKNVTKSIKKDNTEEITTRVREMLFDRGGLYKRLVSAFDFEASEKYLLDKFNKVREGASKVIGNLELEKNRRIHQIVIGYNKKIESIKEKNKRKKKK